MTEIRDVSAHTPESSPTLELRTDELQALAHVREIGRVRIRRRVVTEMRTIQVPVRREELVIEHLTSGAAGADNGGEPSADEGIQVRELQPGDVLNFDLAEEEVVVQTRAVIFERVQVGKRAVRELTPRSFELRREELQVNSSVENSSHRTERSGERNSLEAQK